MHALAVWENIPSLLPTASTTSLSFHVRVRCYLLLLCYGEFEGVQMSDECMSSLCLMCDSFAISDPVPISDPFPDERRARCYYYTPLERHWRWIFRIDNRQWRWFTIFSGPTWALSWLLTAPSSEWRFTLVLQWHSQVKMKVGKTRILSNWVFLDHPSSTRTSKRKDNNVKIFESIWVLRKDKSERVRSSSFGCSVSCCDFLPGQLSCSIPFKTWIWISYYWNCLISIWWTACFFTITDKPKWIIQQAFCNSIGNSFLAFKTWGLTKGMSGTHTVFILNTIILRQRMTFSLLKQFRTNVFVFKSEGDLACLW